MLNIIQTVDSLRKLFNVSTILVNMLNSQCSCQFSTLHMVESEQYFSCLQEDEDSIVYITKIIGTSNISSLQLIKDLKRWTTKKPKIAIAGIEVVVQSCNNECTSCPASNYNNTTENKQYQLSTLILGIVLGIFIALQLFTCLLLINYCNKYYSSVRK